MVMTMIPSTVGSWQDQAGCLDADPELFFPERGAYTDGVRALCGRCPVQAQCLEHALVHRENHGVWGGLTPPERQALRTGRLRLRSLRA